MRGYADATVRFKRGTTASTSGYLCCSCAPSINVRLPAAGPLRERRMRPNQRKVVLATFPRWVPLREQRAGCPNPPLLHSPDSYCVRYLRSCVHKILHERRTMPGFSEESRHRALKAKHLSCAQSEIAFLHLTLKVGEDAINDDQHLGNGLRRSEMEPSRCSLTSGE